MYTNLAYREHSKLLRRRLYSLAALDSSGLSGESSDDQQNKENTG